MGRKITFVTWYLCCAIYDGDRLLCDERDNGDYRIALAVLKALGYETDRISVEWEDMPKQGYQPGQVYKAPKSLSSLKEHLAQVAEKKRQQKIQYHREQLAYLERGE